MVAADEVPVRTIGLGDHARWAGLYRAYRQFYRPTPDEAVVQRVWVWAGPC